MHKLFCSSSNTPDDCDITSKYIVPDYNSPAEMVYEDFNDHMEKILLVQPLRFNELKKFIEKEKKIAEVIFTEKCGTFRTDLSEDMKKNIAYHLISLKAEINARADRCKNAFLIQDAVSKAVEEGVSHHNQKMIELAQQTIIPLTNSQIKKYHLNYLEAVTKALTSTISIENAQISPEILKNAIQKLEKDINSQLYLHLQRQETAINNTIKAILTCTLEAEAFYDAEMDAFIQTYGTTDGLSYVDESFKVHHQKVREKAEFLWLTSIRDKKLENFLNASAELSAKLDEKYSYLVEDCEESSNEN